MELLEGESLAQRLTRGALQVVEAVEISLRVLSALEALHREGLICRPRGNSTIAVSKETRVTRQPGFDLEGAFG
jgi:hypothetical protein